MQSIHRRQFVKLGLTAGAGIMFLPSLMGEALGDALTADPHFFLMLTLPDPSGLDSSYLFDARPGDMTQKGLIQNYRKSGEAQPWVGSNGVSTLATDLANPLLPYKSYFSIVNGVFMSAFDGHDQNINYLFTGDAFGGESFIPHLNSTDHKALDAVMRGKFFCTQTNGSGTVPLDPSGAKSLVASLANVPPLNPSSGLFQQLLSRFSANGLGGGGFSAGSAAMANAFQSTTSLSQMISQIQTDGNDTDTSFIELISRVFRVGAAKGAILVFDPGNGTFDTHDPTSAGAQPKLYGDLATKIASVFEQLRTLPFDSTRSMLDVTTVMFSAEFGRTMKQYGNAVDKTGTDHNPLANSMLLGGKGIKGGQVIGSTDFASSTETLSAAHLSLDPSKLKAMGRPFDFAASVSRTDLPTQYAASDYIGMPSVANTIYSLFGVSKTKWRVVERNGSVAPILGSLLSS